MILMIDNYDSFTYNLVQYFGELGASLKIYRNDALSIDDIKRMRPAKIVISPGPGRPEGAGISVDIIRTFAGKIPILGVCLGHQCIGYAYGGRIIRAKKLMHGKTSMIRHDNKEIFKDVANPFEATRYHSLVRKGSHSAYRLPLKPYIAALVLLILNFGGNCAQNITIYFNCNWLRTKWGPKKIPFQNVSGKRKSKPIKEDVSPSPHFGNSATISSLTCHGLRMPGTHARAFWV